MQKEYMEINYVEMGRRIREKRNYLKMNRETLAEKLDISPQFLALVEYGTKGLSLKNAYLMSQVLDVPMDYLTAGTRGDEGEDTELMMARQRIMSILCECDAKQLEGIEKIAMIYVDGVKKK